MAYTPEAQVIAQGSCLFRVSNHHDAGCGLPPVLDGDVPHYIGYFANEYGEQAIYAYDYTTGLATLRMGDLGWENVLPVIDGQVPDVRLNEPEAAWLRACCLATGLARRRGQKAPDLK